MRCTRAGLLAALIIVGGCSGRIDYNKALFKHVPDDPELLLLARPNELTDFTQKTLAEMGIQEMFSDMWQADFADLDQYREVTVEIIEALGLPWRDIQVVGVLVYFKKPVFLASGEIKKDEVVERLTELGFKQNSNGTFNYVYEAQKLYIPEDGIMMMAEEDLLEFLMDVPEDKRLWNRPDFADYRTKSPLDNTVFVWSNPPDYFLKSFEYRDDLGSVSLALDMKSAIQIKNTIHINDPNKTVMLYNLLNGAVHIGRAAFGNHKVYSPIFNGVEVTQDNQRVVTSLVVPASQVPALRDQLAQDLGQPSSDTLSGFRRFFDAFK